MNLNVFALTDPFRKGWADFSIWAEFLAFDGFFIVTDYPFSIYFPEAGVWALVEFRIATQTH